MKKAKLKGYLNQIAERLTKNSMLEDVYQQLSLLSDIEGSEEQVKNGETLTQTEVEVKA